MTKQEQTTHFNEFINKMRMLLDKKGNDYSGADRLSNFKSVAKITTSAPDKVILTLIATKVARLGELLNSGNAPQNESIYDSIVDLANYSVLLDACIKEHQAEVKAGKTITIVDLR